MHIFSLEGKIAGKYLSNYKNECGSILQCTQNALSTFVRVAPDLVLPKMIAYSTGLLDKSELLLVTQAEHGVFTCPKGELYDKTLLLQ